MRIENIVASADLGTKVNLKLVNQKLKDTEYNPSSFPALIYTNKNPRMVILLFDSGKIACTGARSIDAITVTLDKFVNELRRIGAIGK